MPVLKNARHEKFAQALAKGKTTSAQVFVATRSQLDSCVHNVTLRLMVVGTHHGGENEKSGFGACACARHILYFVWLFDHTSSISQEP